MAIFALQYGLGIVLAFLLVIFNGKSLPKTYGSILKLDFVLLKATQGVIVSAMEFPTQAALLGQK